MAPSLTLPRNLVWVRQDGHRPCRSVIITTTVSRICSAPTSDKTNCIETMATERLPMSPDLQDSGTITPGGAPVPLWPILLGPEPFSFPPQPAFFSIGTIPRTPAPPRG